jgi:hypothetical protein
LERVGDFSHEQIEAGIADGMSATRDATWVASAKKEDVLLGV